MILSVDPLRLPLGGQWKGIDLMLHQEEARTNAHARRMVVEAPTGGGKTWCGAVDAVDRLPAGDGALFVYPTNALADDQAGSLRGLLSRAGLSAAEVDETGRPDAKGADVLIWRLHATALDALSGAVQRKTRGATIENVLSNLPMKPLWIVTNPDTMFMLVTARYDRAPAIWNRLASCKTLVLDEFHLYRGPQLVRALVMIELSERLFGVERVRILSATLATGTRSVLTQRLGYRSIVATAGSAGRVVQQPLRLELVNCADAADAGEAILQRVTPLLPTLRNEAAANPHHVPLVVLRQSPVAAMALEDEMHRRLGVDHAEVGIYRGLTSKAIRSMYGKTLVVGTSALEVGVDFQTTRGIFEALSASSFAQRLGRFGRHEPGEVTFLTKAQPAAAFAKLAPSCSRERLLASAQTALESDDELDGFILSGWALLVLRATLGSLRKWTSEVANADGLNATLDHIEGVLSESLGLSRLAPRVQEIISRRVQLRLTDGIGFRGSAGSADVFDVRERRRRDSDEHARFSVDLATFFRRAKWATWPPDNVPKVVGWAERRALSLKVVGAEPGVPQILAPDPEALELRLDGQPTEAESLLRERQVIVGLFPKRLRDRLSWREVAYESGDHAIALLDDDALVGGYLFTRPTRPA